MARHSLNLATKTTVLLAAITLTVLLGVIVPLLRYQENILRDTILQGLDGQAVATAHGIDLFLESGLRDSDAISATLPLDAISRGRLDEIASSLKQMQKVFPTFGSGIFVLDNQGKFLADYPSHPELRGQSYAFREYYQRTMAEQKGVIGQPYRSNRTKSLVLTFTAPVRDSQGQIVAIVGGSMDLLAPEVLGGYLEQHFGKTGYLYVFDSHRQLLLHPERDRILTSVQFGKNSFMEAALHGVDGGGETVNSRGVPMLVSVRRIPKTDWMVAVQLPRQEAYAPIAKARTGIIGASSLAILFVTAIGAATIRRVARPLNQLEQVASQITADLEKMETTGISKIADPALERLIHIRSRDEIGQLAASFLKLTTRLHSTFYSLNSTNLQLLEAKEAALAEASHHQFQHSLSRAINEVSLDGILAVNGQGVIVSHNQRLLDILQITLPNISDNPVKITVGAPDQPVLSSVVDLVKNPESFLKRVRELYNDPDANDHCEIDFKDGRTLERYSTSLRSEKDQYIGRVWFFRDITARKQTEEARKISEKVVLEWKKRLEMAEKAALPIGLWEWDFTAGTLVCSDEVYRQFGCTSDSFPGVESFFNRLHPEDRPSIDAAVQSVALGSSQTFDVQFRVIRPDGTTCWLDARGAMASNGSPRMIGIAIDITKLRRSEANYRSMVETAPYGIFESTMEGRFLVVNPALVEMLGYNESELLSLDIELDVYSNPGDRVRLMSQLSETGYLKDVEVEYKRKDGSTITVRISAVPVREGSGNIEAIGFIQDVTERKSLARQFWRAQKMEAIGRLAGGVAHDFNNVLMIVSSYADLILQSPDNDEKIVRYAEQIHQSATKAVSVTRQLLAFSRQQLLEPEILDLNTIVAELGKILPKLLGEDIAVATTLEPTLRQVKVDRGQMEQIVMNLAVNARDAMPKGGRFEINTQNVELDATYAAQHAPMNPGLYVKLSVTDTGIGMHAETKLRIFEPFFTTKERGKGTGLGLATVYGIVKQSGGFIWVTSEVGHGTSFDVYLPQLRESVKSAQKLRMPTATFGGPETILLVEDEGALRAAIGDFLRSKGYSVLEAGDGTEAMRTCEQHTGNIDVILTDLVMPGMDGIEVATAVSSRFPEIRILYMSGYTDRAAELLGAGAVLLKKPFSLSDLASKLRAVLEAPQIPPNPPSTPSS